MQFLRLGMLAVVFLPLSIKAQNGAAQPDSPPKPPTTPAKQTEDKSANATNGGVDAKIDAKIDAALDKYNKQQAKNSDFELSLGIGSLINAAGATDYTNQSNVINSTNLGRASPQYLVGGSFRAPFGNFRRKSVAAEPAGGISAECKEGYVSKNTDPSPPSADSPCWQQRPWKAFLSLKLSSSASQTLNGYVLGGSYQMLHYLDILVGFGLTPFNEAGPGFRVTAAQYVTAQQALGNDLNFNPAAMLKGSKNAFDGFPVTNSSGALIYKGNPLEVHYRGGVVIGVSIPLSLKSAFQ